MSFLLAALPERRPRQDRRLLHPRLQSGLDLPRRLQLDRSACGRIEDRPAHRADADVERDRLLRRPGVCRWATAPSGTTSTATKRTAHLDRLSPAGAARRPGAGRQEGGVHLRSQSRPRLGRRRILDRALVADRSDRASSASASISKARIGRARKSPSTNTTATSSSACPACPKPPRPRGSIRWPTCASSARFEVVKSDLREARAQAHRCRDEPGAEIDPATQGRRSKTARPSASKSMATWSKVFRRRRASKSSTRKRWSTGAGPNMRCPGYIESHVDCAETGPRGRRVLPAADVPLADADSHPQRRGQVAQRNRPVQSAVDASDRLRRGSAFATATWRASPPRSATSSIASGSPKRFGPASPPVRTTWAAGGASKMRRAIATAPMSWT